MLTRLRKDCTLYGVPVISPEGLERRQEIGRVRAAFTVRSSEETDEDDLERSMETVYAVIPARYVPVGGLRRSMILQCGDVTYRMLNPVNLGTMWSVKCLRVHL